MRHHGRRLTGAGVLVGLLLSVLLAPPAQAVTTVSVAPSGYTTVDKTFPTVSYWRWAGADNGVGFVNVPEAVATKRFLLAFPTSSFAGRSVTSAHLRVFETFSYSCTATGVEAWRTGPISVSTTWNTQPAWSTKLSTRVVAVGRTGCTPAGAWVDFDVTSAASALSASGGSTLTLGLRASSETDNNGWKRFTNNATLVVTYQ